MRTKRQKEEVPSEKLELYDKLLATNPNIERKGASLPYTSVNGHMFTFLTESGILGIRLPPEEREEFLRKYETTLLTAHGVVLKEYVMVPDRLFKDTGELKKYLDMSFTYAMSLTPKTVKKTAGAESAKKVTGKRTQRKR